MRKLFGLLLAASLAVLSGCNAMHGLGKDLEQLGENIQKKAQ